jgi:hypothetical protein
MGERQNEGKPEECCIVPITQSSQTVYRCGPVTGSHEDTDCAVHTTFRDLSGLRLFNVLGGRWKHCDLQPLDLIQALAGDPL